jgi:hypothetical protein
MTGSVHAEIEIAAPTERVWAVLTDFAEFPRWNPSVRRARGEIRVGARLTIGIRLFGRGTTTFRPVVTRVEPERELRWRTHLVVPGLFDAVRSFRIVPLNEGTSGYQRSVRLIQHEDCTGVLVAPLFALGIGNRILRGFASMNRALKARAEQPARAE